MTQGDEGGPLAMRRAVVIEDDEDVRELLRELLEQSGFAVSHTATGRRGLELVAEEDPDLVTLDLGLPDLDGVEVCRQVRSLTDAYVLMLTARSDEIDRLVGLEIGADDYVTKPFSPREVRARVAALFRRPRPRRDAREPAVLPAAAPAANDGEAAAAPPARESPDGAAQVGETPGVIRHGDLLIDVEGRVARAGGEEIPLTRTEFDLLATLVSNSRRVWPREALLRVVWGTEWVSDVHLVEVHIANLRRKLRQAGLDAGAIRTVRSVGYRIGEPPVRQSGTG